jgi:type III secretion system low calcium response chaperone LcrH/SycD
MSNKMKPFDDSKELEMCHLLMEYIQEGVTLKDLQGISDDAMEGIYAHAYQFYQQGKLDEAEKFFSLLCMYDLSNADFFIGLGAVNQLKKRYQKACDIYALAYILAEDNLSPMFYSGQCYLATGSVVRALRCFQLVIENSDVQTLIKKSQIYVDTIMKNRPDILKTPENHSETEVK